MAKSIGKKAVDGGLEIDRISLANLVSKKNHKTKTAADAAGRPAHPTAGPGIKKANLALLGVLAVLVLLMGLTALFKPHEFSLTFRQGTGKSNTPHADYLRVGPITTTLANEDIVKFSIDIKCKNIKVKEQLARRDSQIRNTIIAVLTAPGTEAFIVKRDYESVRVKIKESLSDLPVDDIYFSELLLY
jgi:flagellar basal body-associated protein FliL